MRIRLALEADRDALYDICLRTGDSGDDASDQFRHPELLGEVWVGPYLTLQPHLAFVAEDDDGAVGYVLGAADTAAFETACEQRWWPALRARYADPPAGEPLTAEGEAIRHVHHPPLAPAEVVADYPAHLHIDILPRGQGVGLGRRLITTLLDALVSLGVSGVHLGVGAQNTRAIGFYRHLGFAPVGPPGDDDDALLLGRRLDADRP